MNWNCAQIEDRLSDYLDRLLEPDERIAFEAHQLECPTCRALVNRVIGTVSRVHALEPVEPPARLVHAILDGTLGPRAAKATGWRAWFGWMETVWQPRFALGLATAVMSAMIVFSALGVDFSKLSRQDFYPANIYHAADRQAHILYARGAKFVNDLRVVYEIQSRLQPEARPAQPGENAPPQPKQNPRQSTAPGRERNRAEDLNPNFLLLASAWSGLPGRSLR